MSDQTLYVRDGSVFAFEYVEASPVDLLAAFLHAVEAGTTEGVEKVKWCSRHKARKSNRYRGCLAAQVLDGGYGVSLIGAHADDCEWTERLVVPVREEPNHD